MKWSKYFVIFLLIISCNQNNLSNTGSQKVTDYFGRIKFISNTIQNTIPLFYVQAEIICAIGAKDKIIAIGKIDKNSSQFINNYFPDILKLPQVGNSNLNYEEILSFKPDIVFTGTDRSTTDRLEELGIVAISTYPKSLRNLLDEVSLFGDILEKSIEADRINLFITSIFNTVDSLSIFIKEESRPKVYYIRTDALTTLGGNVLGEIINMSGGKLVTEHIGDNANSIQVSFEDIYKFNPDVIIIRDRSQVNPDDLFNDSRWTNVKAIQTRRVYKEHFGWTEFRLETVFGIMEKAKWLQPDIFNNLNPESKYEKFIELILKSNQ